MRELDFDEIDRQFDKEYLDIDNPASIRSDERNSVSFNQILEAYEESKEEY